MGKHILVVEDEFALREMLSMVLRDSGYEVDTAKDGSEGIRKILTDRPALVFTDIMMPNMTGVEMIDALRGSDCEYIPVVGLSGTHPSICPDGAVARLDKPCGLGPLLECAKKYYGTDARAEAETDILREAS